MFGVDWFVNVAWLFWDLAGDALFVWGWYNIVFGGLGGIAGVWGAAACCWFRCFRDCSFWFWFWYFGALFCVLDGLQLVGL